jgi:two-component system sensor histidine kinase SenX3
VDVVAAVTVAGTAGLLAGIGLTLAIRGVWRARLLPGSHADSPVSPSNRPYLAADVLERLHIAALAVDRHDKVVLRNPVAATMGLTRGDDLALNDLRALVRAARAADAACQAQIELLHRWWPRDAAAVQARAIPVGRAGDVAVLVEDVTEARRVADMRRDFIANVSHELKTPIGALSLLAEAVREADEDPQAVRRFADRMHREASRLAQLVSELIELSRLEAAEPPGDAEPVSIRQVVLEAADRVHSAAAAAAIEVTVDAADDVCVRGDREQLITALGNLLGNAIVYSPPETGVHVATRNGDLEGRPAVLISVSDQGIGIADSDTERIFERFYRADPARSRATGGTGLGLAIVKHVAANHGGRVDVRSRAGRGSTFTLTLPTVEDRPSAAGTAPASVSGGTSQ